MSISQNFPAISPSLSLNFARSKTLDPRITFARPSTSGDATYMNENGLIVTAAADEPRFDHKIENGVIKSLGLLIEDQRTNIVRKSEDLTITIGRWSEIGDGVTVTTEQVVAPDGNTTANKVAIKTSDSGTKAIQSSILSGSISGSGTAITSSIFCKAAGHYYVRVDMEGGSNSGGIVVDLSDGSLITEVSFPDDYNIEPYPNNWYRISATSTTASTNATALRVYLTDSSGNTNGWTGTPGDGVYMWGGQHEVGAFPTSYIPTDDTPAGKTRSPDNVSMTGTNLADWFNPDEGTVYADTLVNGVKVPSYNRLWSFTNSNFNLEGLGFYISAGINTDGRYGISGEIDAASIYSPSGILSTIKVFDTPRMKSCFGFVKGGNCNVSFNGTLPNSNGVTATDFPDIDRFLIGQPQRFQGYSCMTVSQLTYYPRRLTNDQLQNLTK